MKFLITLLLGFLLTLNAFAGFIGNRNPTASSLSTNYTVPAGKIAVITPISWDLTIGGIKACLVNQHTYEYDSASATAAAIRSYTRDTLWQIFQTYDAVEVQWIRNSGSGTVVVEQDFIKTTAYTCATDTDYLECSTGVNGTDYVRRTLQSSAGSSSFILRPQHANLTSLGNSVTWGTVIGGVETGGATGTDIPFLIRFRTNAATTNDFTVIESYYSCKNINDITVPAGTVVTGAQFLYAEYNL